MEPTYLMLSNLNHEITIPEKGILSHTIYNDDSLKIIIFGFAQGQELTAHTAPMPATFTILEGEATLTLGEDRKDAGPGTLVHMQPKLTHGIFAKTPLLMVLYLHKSARQDTPPKSA